MPADPLPTNETIVVLLNRILEEIKKLTVAQRPMADESRRIEDTAGR